MKKYSVSLSNELMQDRPEPVSYEAHGAVTLVVVRTHIQLHTEQDNTYYTCIRFVTSVPTVSLTDLKKQIIELNPEKWIQSVIGADEQLQKEYTDCVQKWMDTEAATHGYDNIHTACSYENSSIPKFRAEGQACRLWRDNVWTACYAYLDKVLIGEEPLISVEELIDKLPLMSWPN